MKIISADSKSTLEFKLGTLIHLFDQKLYNQCLDIIDNVKPQLNPEHDLVYALRFTIWHLTILQKSYEIGFISEYEQPDENQIFFEVKKLTSEIKNLPEEKANYILKYQVLSPDNKIITGEIPKFNIANYYCSIDNSFDAYTPEEKKEVLKPGIEQNLINILRVTASRIHTDPKHYLCPHLEESLINDLSDQFDQLISLAQYNPQQIGEDSFVNILEDMTIFHQRRNHVFFEKMRPLLEKVSTGLIPINSLLGVGFLCLVIFDSDDPDMTREMNLEYARNFLSKCDITYHFNRSNYIKILDIIIQRLDAINHLFEQEDYEQGCIEALISDKVLSILKNDAFSPEHFNFLKLYHFSRHRLPVEVLLPSIFSYHKYLNNIIKLNSEGWQIKFDLWIYKNINTYVNHILRDLQCDIRTRHQLYVEFVTLNDPQNNTQFIKELIRQHRYSHIKMLLQENSITLELDAMIKNFCPIKLIETLLYQPIKSVYRNFFVKYFTFYANSLNASGYKIERQKILNLLAQKNQTLHTQIQDFLHAVTSINRVTNFLPLEMVLYINSFLSKFSVNDIPTSIRQAALAFKRKEQIDLQKIAYIAMNFFMRSYYPASLTKTQFNQLVLGIQENCHYILNETSITKSFRCGLYNGLISMGKNQQRPENNSIEKLIFELKDYEEKINPVLVNLSLAISYKLFIATGLGQLTNSISNLISELHIFCSIHRQLVPLEYLSQNLQNLTDKITKWIIKSSTIKSCKKPSTRIAPVNLFKQPASFKFLLYRKTGVNINMQPEIKEHKIYLRTKDLYSFLTPATQNPKKRKSTGSISSTTVLA